MLKASIAVFFKKPSRPLRAEFRVRMTGLASPWDSNIKKDSDLDQATLGA